MTYPVPAVRAARAERFVALKLDHQPMHEVLECEDAYVATHVRWSRREAARVLPQLDRIDLYETRGCGAILSWGEDGPALPV